VEDIRYAEQLKKIWTTVKETTWWVQCEA